MQRQEAPMSSLKMTSLLSFSAAMVMLVIHLLGFMSVSNEFMIATAIMIVTGAAFAGVSVLARRFSRGKLDGDIDRFHSEIEEFLKSNDATK